LKKTKEADVEILIKLRILPEGKASIRFKSGAYTIVREYFGSDRNTAIRQTMKFYSTGKVKRSSHILSFCQQRIIGPGGLGEHKSSLH
jgi:hypothetical protein